MESSKVYVNVMAEFTADGRLLPRSFIWKDGHVYEIQKNRCKKSCKPESRQSRDKVYIYCGWQGEPSVL